MVMHFRHAFRLAGAALLLCVVAAAQTQPLNLDQLMKFLTSSIQMKMSDADIGKYLSKIKLSEKLDDNAIDKLLATGIGQKTLAALKVLRDQSESLSKAKPVVAAMETRKVAELPPPPDARQQADIIEEVREYALNYTKNLPDFLCTQVVKRYQAASPGSRYSERQGQTEPSWTQVDMLTLRLSFFEQKEEYKLTMVGSRMATQDYKNVGGATSTGEFGSLLRGIFERGTHAHFEWARWARVRGHVVMAFHYSVEQQNSQWGIEYEKKDHIVPAYSGEVFMETDSPHMVLRATLEADNLPATFPVKMAATILDYDYTDLSGHPFLLPSKSETQMSADGILTRNDTEFRIYRKYSADSGITYDITDPPADDKTAKVDCKDPKNAKDPACKK
jgi:hypothetical protein